MSSHFMKPLSKELFCDSRGCEGQRDDETLPQFYLWLQSPDLLIPGSPTSPPHYSPHHAPFPSALFLAVPSGEEASLSLHPRKHLGGPGKAVLWGGSHRSLSSDPQSRNKARNPARPPHAASPNRPFQTNPCCLRGICNTTWAALSLPLPHYCLCIVYILYIYLKRCII